MGAALVWGLAQSGDGPALAPPNIATFTVRPPDPPEPEPSPRPSDRSESEASAGGGSPAIVAAAIPVAPSSPAVASTQSPAAASGSGTGTGTGAGSGSGAGPGSGVGGDGTGGIAIPARRLSGALQDRDYPRSLADRGASGTVRIGFRVRTDGRVDRCTIAQSSGHVELDSLTCALFTQRFRFAPATNADGQPVESTLQTSFTWGTRRR
ncbi:TonB family protein [Altererythrobacter aerius]|uniref:Protein TonB n=1 Tax=Tsuneonella aeria TaxID=1837929 RepID=A0A6I4TG35_9SPHN|nr:energy transducer TonB [Tsuneonella aeria]MXO76113.1 TonB family protein [Tsuneonella aeria]